MATVLIQAFITLDGFLAQEGTLSGILHTPDRYGILQTCMRSCFEMIKLFIFIC